MGAQKLSKQIAKPDGTKQGPKTTTTKVPKHSSGTKPEPNK